MYKQLLCHRIAKNVLEEVKKPNTSFKLCGRSRPCFLFAPQVKCLKNAVLFHIRSFLTVTAEFRTSLTPVALRTDKNCIFLLNMPILL